MYFALFQTDFLIWCQVKHHLHFPSGSWPPSFHFSHTQSRLEPQGLLQIQALLTAGRKEQVNELIFSHFINNIKEKKTLIKVYYCAYFSVTNNVSIACLPTNWQWEWTSRNTDEDSRKTEAEVNEDQQMNVVRAKKAVAAGGNLSNKPQHSVTNTPAENLASFTLLIVNQHGWYTSYNVPSVIYNTYRKSETNLNIRLNHRKPPQNRTEQLWTEQTFFTK